MYNQPPYDRKALQQQLRYEYQQMQKYQMYAHRCNDGQVRKSCQKMVKKHQDQYLQLLNQLN